MHVIHSTRRTETLHSATQPGLARLFVSTHQGCRLPFTKADKHTLCTRQGKHTVSCLNFTTQFVLNKYSEDAALENAVTVVAFCLASG